MPAPLFTVGIPVYNGMPYLQETLDSVLRQTYRDFELLVINDGSSDASLEYLRSVRDPRLRVISQPNAGLTATLNRMLSEASAPWLVRLDADDIACQDRLAWVAEAIHKSPDAGMFFSRAVHHGHARAIAGTRSSEGDPCALRDLTRAGYLLSICHSSAVLNVKKTRAAGGYRFNLHVEDLDLWWRMALHHSVVFLPRVTVEYRLNNASVCINNMQKLALNTLYVQYLLLSHLWQLAPEPYDTIISRLARLVDTARLRYREDMWFAAIHLSERQHVHALPHLAAAMIRSPRHFLSRFSYPLRRQSAFRVGENPERFRDLRTLLWPGTATAHLQS